jgi:uncharacterized protein (DUF2235 family)
MPKNLILLSDGTGNSAAAPFKTNVWRLYQAIDIEDSPSNGPEQVVHYGNGVGTGTAFKPLAILGLAIGLGLAKNVKELYTFLCRNYEEGDDIYLFGFSRGAFTVRILAGLIGRCGLVKAKSEDELQRRVKLAYAEYKRDAARRASLTRPLPLGHLLRLGAPKQTDHVRFSFCESGEQVFPKIKFIGVWDTVDAYGMPVDELKIAIDQWIWPLTLADRNLSVHVQRACHALSLDDERPTFRPVLWNDPNEDPRLMQVWFAGVHANVGGGYPDDGLAYRTLQWMMDEAEQCGLRFLPELRQRYEERADAQGQQYNSRSGLAGYYRYGPRNVDDLCHDKEHGVEIPTPLIHQSVVSRLTCWEVGYAPLSLPTTRYSVVQRAPIQLVPTVSLASGPTLVRLPAPESEEEIMRRRQGMAPALDAVFRRRVAYFSTVALTVVLAILPLIDFTRSNHTSPSGQVCMIGKRALTDVLSYAQDATDCVSSGMNLAADLPLFPGSSVWLSSFSRHPVLVLICLPVLVWLFFRKSLLLQEQICARAEYAWAVVFRKLQPRRQPSRPKPVWTDSLVRRLRSSAVTWKAYRFVTRRVVPVFFALFAALIGLVILPFFLPKFYRNIKRRRGYNVKLSNQPALRVAGRASTDVNRGSNT